MTHQPYSSMLERAYDNLDAWHRARVDRRVESRYGHLDEYDRALIAGQRKSAPGICIIALVNFLSFLFAAGIAKGVDLAFGVEEDVVMAIGIVGWMTCWMVTLTALVVRKIHRQNAAAAAGLKE